jgi:flavorubredoxin
MDNSHWTFARSFLNACVYERNLLIFRSKTWMQRAMDQIIDFLFSFQMVFFLGKAENSFRWEKKKPSQVPELTRST